MDTAFESERIIRLKEAIQTSQGLLEAGFVVDQHTGLLRWERDGLRIDAGEDWMFGWRLLATATTHRTAMCDEFKLPPQVSRGDLIARLLKCWRSVFKTGPAPDALQDGLLWEQFQNEMRQVRVRTSMLVHADTPFLSQVIKRIKEGTGDPEIAISYMPGQLVVIWDGAEYHVPAHGHWIGSCKVLASMLIEALPGRLPARSTPIAYANGTLSLAYRTAPATWVET